MMRSKRGDIYLPASPRFKASTKPRYLTHFDAWTCPRCDLTFPTEENAFEHLNQMHARRVWDSIDDGPKAAPPPKEVNPPTQRAKPKVTAPTVTVAPPKVVKRPREETVSIIGGPDGVNMEIRTVNGEWLCPACHATRGSANAISRHLSSNCPMLKNGYEQPKESLFKREAQKPQRLVSQRQQCRALGIRMEELLSLDDDDKSRLSETGGPSSREAQFDKWIIVPEEPIAESTSAEFSCFPTKFRFKRQRTYRTDKRKKLTEKLNDDTGGMDECSPPIAPRH
jgi:rubredoxin